jgi:hypothetical protein
MPGFMPGIHVFFPGQRLLSAIADASWLRTGCYRYFLIFRNFA